METPLLNPHNLRVLTKQQEEYCKNESSTNEVINILYEHYTQNTRTVFGKIYRATLSRLSQIADNIANKKMTDAEMISFLSSGDKLPKTVEAFRLQAEGLGYNGSIRDYNDGNTEIDGKDIVTKIMEEKQ